MNTTTHYTTTAYGSTVYSGSSLEHAIRAWDGATYQDVAPDGGIEVRTWNSAGDMVRDGWILHVDAGRVYLHPRLEAV